MSSAWSCAASVSCACAVTGPQPAAARRALVSVTTSAAGPADGGAGVGAGAHPNAASDNRHGPSTRSTSRRTGWGLRPQLMGGTVLHFGCGCNGNDKWRDELGPIPGGPWPHRVAVPQSGELGAGCAGPDGP